MSKWEGWEGDDRLQAHCDRLNAMHIPWLWVVGEQNGKRAVMRDDRVRG